MSTINPKPEDLNYFSGENDHARMFQMIFGAYAAQIIHTVAKYSIAEHFAAGRRTAVEIAQAESLDLDATFRLMRACVSIGLLTHDSVEGFRGTSLLAILDAGVPGSMRGVALLIPGQGHWLPWGRLYEAVRTGQPQSVAALGQTAWDYLSTHPEEAAAFVNTMSATSRVVNADIVESVDIGNDQTIVDVGGANGNLVQSLMARHTSARGIVFDLPHVVPTALDAALATGLDERFTVAHGNFLTDDLPPGDLYLLKVILHDWNDEDSVSILKNCRRNIHANGRILIVEQIIDTTGTASSTTLLDLDMLVMLGGKERTLDEYKELLSQTGFRFTRLTRTSTPFFIIEAAAV